MQIIINVVLVIICSILFLTIKDLNKRVESLEDVMREVIKAVQKAAVLDFWDKFFTDDRIEDADEED